MQLMGLTQPEAEVVMQSTLQAVKQDIPTINQADGMEVMYQMANIAKYKWSSPIPSGGDLVQKIRASSEYQNLINRVKSKGTVYGTIEDRALSPYFNVGGPAAAAGGAGGGDVLSQVKGALSIVPTWAWIAGGAAVALLVLMPSGRRR